MQISLLKEREQGSNFTPYRTTFFCYIMIWHRRVGLWNAACLSWGSGKWNVTLGQLKVYWLKLLLPKLYSNPNHLKIWGEFMKSGEHCDTIPVNDAHLPKEKEQLSVRVLHSARKLHSTSTYWFFLYPANSKIHTKPFL